MVDDLIRRALLHSFSLPEHKYLVAECLDKREVMADQEKRQARALQPGQKLEHLLLYRDIKCARRLIAPATPI